MIPLPSLLLLGREDGCFTLYAGNSDVAYLPALRSATVRVHHDDVPPFGNVLGLFLAPC